jgi:hypothetical protein
MNNTKLILVKIFTFFCAISLLSCSSPALNTIYILKPGSFNWNKKETCTIAFVSKSDSIILNGAIKLRGGISRRYFKHSYALKLATDYSLNGLPADDDWILNAGYIDKTFMRHKLSYELFMAMHPNNIAAKSNVVRVVENNKPIGLYLLMEELDASSLKIDKSDTAALIFKDPPIFLGYQDTLPTANYYQQKFPKYGVNNKNTVLHQFHDFLYNSSIADFEDNIWLWLDKQSIIDWHLILLFSNNADGIMKNWFLYKQNAQTPFKIAIWDYDHSFGRDGDNEYNMMDRPLNCEKSILFKRLLNTPSLAYEKALAKRWNELRQNDVFSEKHTNKLIAHYDKVIRLGIEENTKIWPNESKWYYDNNDYEQEVQIIKTFIALRLKQLDNRFNS